MAMTSGTATDYQDLLDKLRQWLVDSVGWTQLSWTPAAGLLDTAVLNLRGPGAGPERQVFVNIRTQNNPALPAYSWEVRGALGYNSGQTWGSAPGESPSTFFNLWQNLIAYWFYANDRRFIVVAKIGTTYQSMYAGFFLPFALPSEYPLPFYISGSLNVIDSYTTSANNNGTPADPGESAAYYLNQSGSTWINFKNRAINNTFGGGPDYAYMWPLGDPDGQGHLTIGSNWKNLRILEIRPNANGEMPLWQSHILCAVTKTCPGALDGVFFTPGFGRVAEQVVNVGGRSFKLFQRQSYSTPRDYFAIEEI